MHQLEKLKNNNQLSQHARALLARISTTHNHLIDRYDAIENELEPKSKQLLSLEKEKEN